MWPSVGQTIGLVLLLVLAPHSKCANDVNSESVSSTFFTSSDSLAKFSLLYGIYNEVNQSDNSDCTKDVQAILDGIAARELWAIKRTYSLSLRSEKGFQFCLFFFCFLVLDTSSNIPPSFVFGNNFWFSPSHLCTDLNDGVSISLSDSIPKLMKSNLMNDTSPIYLVHRMVYANFTSSLQIDIQYHIKVSINKSKRGGGVFNDDRYTAFGIVNICMSYILMYKII